MIIDVSKLDTIKWLYKYCTDIDIDLLLTKLFSELDLNKQFENDECQLILDIAGNIDEDRYPNLFVYFKTNFLLFIAKILQGLESDYYAADIEYFFSNYGVELSEYISTPDGLNLVQTYMKNTLANNLDYNLSDEEDTIYSMDEVESFHKKIETDCYEYFSYLELPDSFDYPNLEIDKDFWEGKIRKNIIDKEEMEEYESQFKYEKVLDDKKSNEDEDVKIEKLFS